ncbi:MAG: hypothetical protein ACYTDY_00865 [Planctomycetota bacterium]|jgi:hypothetical protein
MAAMRATLAVPPLLLLLLVFAPLAGEESWKKREIFYPGKAEIAPFPREVPLNGTITFKITLKRKFKSPVITVTDPAGATRYYVKPDRTVGSSKPEFDVGFKGRKGAYRVELVVDSERGDTTAAQFTIWVGVKRPETLPETSKRRPQSDYAPEAPTEHHLRLERKLFRMVNDYRREIGAKPYPWLEKAAVLAREHWKDYHDITPRPKKLTHIIPGGGSIADRFMDTYAWPYTERKFPIRDPKVGPEADCYCSELLAAPRSLEWLFKEYCLKESAFRSPIISKFPTHAGVGIVREEASAKLYTAVVFVQVNATRVLADLEKEWKETQKLESRAQKDPAERAELLRRLARMGDPRSLDVFKRRLDRRDPTVAAAALDGLFLNDPEQATKWVERQIPRLARAHREKNYKNAIPLIRTLMEVKYDFAVRTRGRMEFTQVSDLADRFLEASLRLIELGEREDARADLTLIVQRFAGLPAAEKAEEKLRELEERK